MFNRTLDQVVMALPGDSRMELSRQGKKAPSLGFLLRIIAKSFAKFHSKMEENQIFFTTFGRTGFFSAQWERRLAKREKLWHNKLCIRRMRRRVGSSGPPCCRACRSGHFADLWRYIPCFVFFKKATPLPALWNFSWWGWEIRGNNTRTPGTTRALWQWSELPKSTIRRSSG